MLLKYKNDANLKVLDMNLPVKYLSVHELVLVERHFADMPDRQPRSVKCSTPPTEAESPLQRRQSEWEAQLVSEDKELTCYDLQKCSGEYTVSGCALNE